MRGIFDKDGNAIPHEEFAVLAFQAVEKVRRENEERLIEQVITIANSKAMCVEDFDRSDALMLIGLIKNHDKSYIKI